MKINNWQIIGCAAAILASVPFLEIASAKLFSDRSTVVHDGATIKVVYAYLLPNGIVNKVKVFSQPATGKSIALLPQLFTGNAAQQLARQYGLS